MRNLLYHAAHRGRILALHNLIEASKPESRYHFLVFHRGSDLGAVIFNPNFAGGLLLLRHFLELLCSLAANGSNLLAVAQLRERVKRSLDYIVRIGRAQTLGEDVLDAGRGHHSAHRTTGAHT